MSHRPGFCRSLIAGLVLASVPSARGQSADADVEWRAQQSFSALQQAQAQAEQARQRAEAACWRESSERREFDLDRLQAADRQREEEHRRWLSDEQRRTENALRLRLLKAQRRYALQEAEYQDALRAERERQVQEVEQRRQEELPSAESAEEQGAWLGGPMVPPPSPEAEREALAPLSELDRFHQHVGQDATLPEAEQRSAVFQVARPSPSPERGEVKRAAREAPMKASAAAAGRRRPGPTHAHTRTSAK